MKERILPCKEEVKGLAFSLSFIKQDYLITVLEFHKQ